MTGFSLLPCAPVVYRMPIFVVFLIFTAEKMGVYEDFIKHFVEKEQLLEKPKRKAYESGQQEWQKIKGDPHKIQQEIIKLKEKISTLKGKQERRWLGFQIPNKKSEDDRTNVEILTENSGTQPE